MGLYCEVRYDDRMLGRPLPERARLTKWHIEERQWLRPGDRVADFEAAAEAFTVRIRFPCLVDRLMARTGKPVRQGAFLLVVAAEGEDVPEGFRYAAAEPLG